MQKFRVVHAASRSIVPVLMGLVLASSALAQETPTAGLNEPAAAVPVVAPAPAPAPTAPSLPAPSPLVVTPTPPLPPPPPPLPPPPPPAPVAPAPVVEEPSKFESSVSWGVGIRTWATMDTKVDAPVAEDGTMGPDPDDPQFAVGYNLRPYVGGTVHKNIKFEGNLDANGANIRVLDAVLKFEFSDLFNIWAGHFLPPTDRANLSGPFFQNAWNYPTGQHLYPSGYAGRNDGIAYWGMVGEGAFKWQVGLFDMGAGTAKPRVAGRLTLNLLDPEPGYYNSSTYYGTKDILALGLVVHHMPDAVPGLEPESATLYSVDGLYESKVGGAGTVTIEPAFYSFAGLEQGSSFSILASFLFPGKVGLGQLQPMVRLQQASWADDESFSGLGPDGSSRTIDAALNWIIDGHNARLTANFQNSSVKVAGAETIKDTQFTLGAQIQRF